MLVINLNQSQHIFHIYLKQLHSKYLVFYKGTCLVFRCVSLSNWQLLKEDSTSWSYFPLSY